MIGFIEWRDMEAHRSFAFATQLLNHQKHENVSKILIRDMSTNRHSQRSPEDMQ